MTVADKELVKLCLREVLERAGYAEDRRLSQSDLEYLCYLVEEKSNVLISLSTLKRVFQGKFERLPQAATLDAITVFIGYSGWQDFKSKKSVSDTIAISSGTTHIHKRNRFNALTYGAAAAILIAAVVIIISRTSSSTPDNDDAEFMVKKIVSENVPKNVIFSYNIDNIKGDSFFIQPTWNRRLRVNIRKNSYTQTQTYYEPGHHTAKLICDGRVLKTVAVHIPTPNWIGYTKSTFFDMYPQYFRSEHVIQEHFLGIDEDGLKASQVAYDKNKIYYFAHFPDSLNVRSSAFTLKARIRTRNIGNSLCPWIVTEAYGEDGFFYFTNTTPGCTSEIQAAFSDKILDGKKSDLSAFGLAVTEWNNVRIDVRDKVVSIYVNEVRIFSDKFSRPAGKLQGMGFGSNGLCEVDFVELTDPSGRVVYYNDFEQPTASR